ncbi:homocysteine S-methyltransferase-like isoform X2 [Anopheles aquasalis]|nr:homocysteine S-methyltransferase-like isoform X2 [Anopheles aquasalis]XP_050089654.1 homocysteine S-methyltransferase-like isoform X2 [Anopheles aquasalis]XP_050089655.1 homocysteine S-methyltransferase-like isoform X2 [Anopheles aquasalis]XP_050089656.1 homocysteine S-methyltransferase-like isoform X2 [Anopheles aquasalis]
MSGVTVLDGGFATQLSVHVGKSIDGDPLWSARFNATNPNAVFRTHLDFLEAGAEAIMTNTYQASIEGYGEYLHLNEDASLNLIKSTVRVAQMARTRFLATRVNSDQPRTPPLLVASIGPYGAHLHDGSEYTGSYASTVSPDTIQKWHRPRIEACIEAGVDVLGIETIPCKMEAAALFDLMSEEYPSVRFWISFQCKDNLHLANGELFSEAVNSLWARARSRRNKTLLALGVNCVHPQIVTPLFKSVNELKAPEARIPLIVYPNSGEIYTVEEGWQGKEDCVPLEHYVPQWVELGARFIGGCCRTYARDIQRIKQAVESIAEKSHQ